MATLDRDTLPSAAISRLGQVLRDDGLDEIVADHHRSL